MSSQITQEIHKISLVQESPSVGFASFAANDNVLDADDDKDLQQEQYPPSNSGFALGSQMLAEKNVSQITCRSHNEIRKQTCRDTTNNGAREDFTRIDQQLDRIRVQISELALPASEIQAVDHSERREQDTAVEAEYPNASSSRTTAAISPTSVIAVTTSIVSETCRSFCHCQCHKSTQYQTPNWAKSIIGSFSFRANCSVLMNRRKCNYRLCKRSGQTSVRFQYFAPWWLIARGVSLAATKRDVDVMNAAIMITMPRVIPRHAVVWEYIDLSRTDMVKHLLMSDQASIYDVDTDGVSLLYVMTHLRYEVHILMVASTQLRDILRELRSFCARRARICSTM
jgi:hypothetical protein